MCVSGGHRVLGTRREPDDGSGGGEHHGRGDEGRAGGSAVAWPVDQLADELPRLLGGEAVLPAAICIDCCAPLSTPDSSLRMPCAPSYHMVVTIAVPTAPAMVRRKFITPAAEAVSSSSTAPRASVVSGMKKNGMPAPWISCGQRERPEVGAAGPPEHADQRGRAEPQDAERDQQPRVELGRQLGDDRRHHHRRDAVERGRIAGPGGGVAERRPAAIAG